MQVGDKALDGNFIASTILEIESLIPLLKKLKSEGRRVNVLYGIPLLPSHVVRLAKAALQLPEEGISIMIDHPDQVDYLHQFSAITGFAVSVFVKVDSGYHRAGLPPGALNKQGLLEKLAAFEEQGHVKLLGVYSHSSLSYAGTTPREAMKHLVDEIEACREAVQLHSQLFPQKQLVISVGATPQALSLQNISQETPSGSQERALRDLLRAPFASDLDSKVKVELHAGVYSLLDMQQLSTKASMQLKSPEEEIAVSVLAEVCSVYNEGERCQLEALIAAGTLALGREPCPSYPGWAKLSSWPSSPSYSSSRLIVERISQEHSIVAWEDKQANAAPVPLSVGQMVKLYPNHACIVTALYNFYFVVDSERDKDAGKIVDVWVRARGSDVTDSLSLSRSQ